MFNGYFNSAGLRANLTRDDTCTVLAEYGNEYSDNGYDRYYEMQKKKMRQDYDTNPVWRGAFGQSSLSSSARPKNPKDDPFYQPTPPRPKVRDIKVKEAAENYIKAKEIRELFRRQRDAEAHDRDLEHLDPQGIEVLPDGTRLRRRPLGSAAKLKRKQSEIFQKNFNRHTGTQQHQAPSLGRGALSNDDAAMLADFLAPPTMDEFGNDITGDNDDNNGVGDDGRKLKRSDSKASLLHSKENRAKYVAKTEDDTGCPIDAGVGIAGLFRLIRQWKQNVPKHDNFTSESITWEPRLDLPLQEEARTFENLMKTQMDAQYAAMNDEEERIRAASRISTPAFFDGDGEGANCIAWGGHNVDLPDMNDVDEFSNSPRVRRNKVTESIKRQYFYDDDDDEEQQQRQRSQLKTNVFKPNDVASPLIGFATHNSNNNNNNSSSKIPSRPTTARTTATSVAASGGRPLSGRSQQQHYSNGRPTSARNYGLNNTTGYSSATPTLPPSQLLTTSVRRGTIANNNNNGSHSARPFGSSAMMKPASISSAERQRNSSSAGVVVEKKVLRRPPPQFKLLNVDPRFVQSSLHSVGQKMLMANKEELTGFSPRR